MILRKTLDELPFAHRANAGGVPIIRFEYEIYYDHYSPEESDDPMTESRILAAMDGFEEDLRREFADLGANASVEFISLAPNESTGRLIGVRTGIRPEQVGEIVQRCARRHHVTAALRTAA